MERGDKNFIIKINGKNVRVTIDRLKPAFLLSEDLEHSPKDSVRTHEETIESETQATQDKNEDRESPNRFALRSGRTIRFPKRLQAGFN